MFYSKRLASEVQSSNKAQSGRRNVCFMRPKCQTGENRIAQVYQFFKVLML